MLGWGGQEEDIGEDHRMPLGLFQSFALEDPLLDDAAPIRFLHQNEIHRLDVTVVILAVRPVLKVHVVPVQEMGVTGIDGILHHLQPVTFEHGQDVDLARDVTPDQGLVAGQQRRRIGTEIGEDQARQLLDPIGFRPDLGSKR